MTITLPFPPSTNHMYVAIGRGRRALSHEARQYRRRVSTMLVELGFSPMTGPIALEADFFRPQRRGDLDNYLKVMLDALNGICWHDDSQIVQICARRHDDRRNPRVVLGIRAWLES